MTQGNIIQWAIAILYRSTDAEPLFLVVENRQTGNISFMSGWAESEDEWSLKTTAQREIQEELWLDPDAYEIFSTDLVHEFTFDEKKVDRNGLIARYEIFLVDASDIREDIDHSSDLTWIKRVSKSEALQLITFPELKQLFEAATTKIENW